jgi:hypothetical protein
MTYQELNLDKPARYRVRVKGTLDPSWSGRLGGMTITTTEQGGETPVTTLTGRLLDQAALLGVLNTLYDYYHCPLVSVEFLGRA